MPRQVTRWFLNMEDMLSPIYSEPKCRGRDGNLSSCRWFLSQTGEHDAGAGLRIEPLPEFAERYASLDAWDSISRPLSRQGVRTWVDRHGQVHDRYGIIARGHAKAVRCGGCGRDLARHVQARSEDVPCPG